MVINIVKPDEKDPPEAPLIKSYTIGEDGKSASFVLENFSPIFSRELFNMMGEMQARKEAFPIKSMNMEMFGPYKVQVSLHTDDVVKAAKATQHFMSQQWKILAGQKPKPYSSTEDQLAALNAFKTHAEAQSPSAGIAVDKLISNTERMQLGG